MLVPCGHTLAHVCPSCAEHARSLRAAQCREGWHLEDEPGITPDPANDYQLTEKRAEAQVLRDEAQAAGTGTTGFDELTSELDAEISRAGIRGESGTGPTGQAAPLHQAPSRRPGLAPPQGQPSDRRQDVHRAGRQDLPALDVRHPDMPELRPDRRAGGSADPESYEYDRAARDALAFAALFDRFIQNLRRYLGYDLQYFTAVEPQ